MLFTNLRKQMRWIIIVIVLAFIGGTVYMGVGQVTQQADAAPPIAAVNGRDVSYVRFQQLYASNVQTYRQLFGTVQGQAAEELMYMSLRNLIESELVYEAAAATELPVADAEITEVLNELKASFPDDATYRRALAASGMNERQLRDIIRDDLRVQKLEEQVRARAQLTLSDEELAEMDEQSIAALQQAAEAEEVRRWLDELWEQADIVIYDTRLQAHDLVRQGRLEEAIVAYEQAMLEDPFNGYLHLSIGAVYEQLGRLDDAIAEYEKAVAMHELDGDLRIRLALAYLDAGRDDDAAATLRETGEMLSWDPTVQFSLAQLFTSMGLEEDAQLAMERLMATQQQLAPEAEESDEAAVETVAPAADGE